MFMPERFPALPAGLLEKLVNADYQTRAVEIMKLFLEEFTEEELRYFASRAYAFGEKFDTKAVAPVHHLMEGTEILELWHGPTCAFKDMALQMLPWRDSGMWTARRFWFSIPRTVFLTSRSFRWSPSREIMSMSAR